MDTDINVELINGIGSKQTRKLTGELMQVMLYLPADSMVQIVSELGYTLFSSELNKGVSCFSLKNMVVNNLGHRMNFQGEAYFINEKLNVYIRSKMIVKRADVESETAKIKLRFK